ncbi:MAG: hypothetical protein QM831_30300 [Kofleriaceae bacterium]
MKFRLACALLLTSLVACGGDDDTTAADAAPKVPQMITLTGTTKATSTSSTALAGVAVTAYNRSDDSMLATATSDTNGNFTMTVMTNGAAVDGYLKATITGYIDTYLYPPVKLAADFDGAAMNMVTTQTVSLLTGFCGVDNYDITAHGAIALEVVDSTGAAVQGAAVATTPAPGMKYCYNGASGGIPSANATVTSIDGIAYALDVSGDVSVTATESGKTFSTVSVKERLGSLTTTQIIAQ